MSEYDAVIVGAGVIGLSTAYHIKRKHPSLRVLVVDKFNAAGQGSTAKSMSAFRCLFSSRVNYLLSDSSVDFYSYVQKELGVDLKLLMVGYLWLLGIDDYGEMTPILRNLAAANNLKYMEYEAEELASRLGVIVHLAGDEEAELMSLKFTDSFNSFGCMPFTILPKPRVLVRPFPVEEVFWLSYADDFPRAFKLEEDPQPEKNFYQYGIYQVLVKYFPQFKDCRPYSSFAGLYEINTMDGHPVVFEEKDLIVVGGASGSGIMKADAIGRIAAALYNGENYAFLYGDRKFRVSDLSIKGRHVEPEKLQI